MEKTLVKTLKALAEYLDLSLGDLLEGMALHALEGETGVLGEDAWTREAVERDLRSRINRARQPSAGGGGR